MARFSTQSLVLAVATSLVGLGCGSSTSNDPAAPSGQVRGVASSESAATSVSLKDSSSPAILRTVVPDESGNFTFDTAGLTAPFFLKAETASGPEYAIASRSGKSDVNPVTTAACAGASSDEDSKDGEEGWSGRDHESSDRIEGVLKALREELKPLFDLYGIGRIGGEDDDHNGINLRALLKDVSFEVRKGVVTVINRATGSVIFTGPLRHLDEGTFYPENMPAGPGGSITCTEFTYSDFADCLPDGTQARTVLTSSPTGCTGGSPVLTQSCTYVPPTNLCTSFTYSAFGACQPNNTQTRTVLTSSPTGCTGGTPVLTQACIYVPPVTCTLATAVPSCSTCHGAIGSGTHANRALTCATCHGPVNNGLGTPSTGMAAALSGTTCRLTYPTSGTHDDGTVNRGAAQ